VFRDVTAEHREQARRDFLARAGAALASSLDYRSTLSSVAQFAVPRLADWCTVHLVEPGGHVPQLVAMAHADPEQLERLRELMERYPIDAEGPSGVPRVIRTAHSELYPDLGGVLAEFSGGNPDGLRILRQLDLRSAMIVPLRGRDRTLGALAFTYAQSERSYTEQDLAFAEEFARRAAMAIENAQAVRQAERAQAEEQRLRHEADLANQAKDEFLATVSHELRTPLNAILGWTATLRGRKPPAELDRPLAIIERNARRQARLIEDVLDVSRIISGKLTLNVGPTNVAETIEGAIESIAPAAEAKQIGIRSDLDPRVTIAADGDRLQQVVWNLLSNAVKFTPKGGSVEIAMYREGPEVCIRVSDTGEGIPRDALPIIFEPFRQADASTTRKHGGLGLGLAIVRQLVAAHGGTIRAESDGPGMGATFVAAFPAGGAVSIGAGSAAESPAPGATTMGATKEAPRLEGLRVLVVDDEEDARDIVAEILREKGATVTTAASATQALEMIAQLQPDVMVSDVAMPEMDGLTLLRKLRALPANRGGRTPALALSAYARREDAQRAFGAGFQMHAAKPVEPAQLVAMVANLAGLSLEAPSPE
ncbi:MAG: response regulator, partial [Myxococcales bacterium]|nr:response regulator [Myxococcales bacterium]